MRSQGIVNGPLSQRSLTGHVSRESHAIGQFSSALRGEPSSLEPSNYRRAKDANAKDTRSDNAVASLVRSSARTKDALCRYPTALPTRTRVTGAPARRNCRFTEQRAGHRPPLAGSRSAVGCINRRSKKPPFGERGKRPPYLASPADPPIWGTMCPIHVSPHLQRCTAGWTIIGAAIGHSPELHVLPRCLLAVAWFATTARVC